MGKFDVKTTDYGDRQRWLAAMLERDDELRGHVERIVPIVIELCSQRNNSKVDLVLMSQLLFAIASLDMTPKECTKDALTAVFAVRHEFDNVPLHEWPMMIHVAVCVDLSYVRMEGFRG